MFRTMARFCILPICLISLILGSAHAVAQELEPTSPSISLSEAEPFAGSEGWWDRLVAHPDQALDDLASPVAKWVSRIVFANIYESGEISLPFILVWMGGSAIILTLVFRFVNLRCFGLAMRAVRNRYTKAEDPGEISHFQALSSAVSGTVGLGNIAGVAIAINTGGPGAAFWMVILGLLGMTTKFAECTLGVKYRDIDANGIVHGGPMKYLSKGLAERGQGFGRLGRMLAILFAFLCVLGSFGGGNMFQVNSAASQFVNITGGADSILNNHRWIIGLALSFLVGMVVIGGISRIGRVTSRLVPLMAILYVIGCLTVLFSHFGKIDDTFALIFRSAFDGSAIKGGVIGVMLIGIQRASFSNEAGLGSAPIAHSAAKTRFAASEGVVALLEPFLDTVVICTMTALVVICTGNYIDQGKDGITLTSESFESVIPWFTYVLSGAVILFALSTLITWSYYGLQAWKFLFGKSRAMDISYKLLFCLVVVFGASMAPTNVVDFSDAAMMAMCFPNLIGVYLLLPVVKRELRKYVQFTRQVDAGSSIDDAHDQVMAEFQELR